MAYGSLLCFLSLTGPFPKVALIHNSLFGVIKTDFSPFKSAKVNYGTL